MYVFAFLYSQTKVSIWSGFVLRDMIFSPLFLSHYFYLNPSLQIFWPVSVRAISGKQEISRREARPVQGSPGFLTYFLLVSSHVPPLFKICTHSLTVAFTLLISLHYLPEPKPHRKNVVTSWKRNRLCGVMRCSE